MFLRQKQDQLKGCVIIVHDQAGRAALGTLIGFRQQVYGCFTRRGDALFDLLDAVTCRPEAITSLPGLSLEPEFRRGHGALYSAVTDGRVSEAGVRELLLGAALPGTGTTDAEPAGSDGLVWFAGDVSGWPRPDAATSPQRLAMFDK